MTYTKCFEAWAGDLFLGYEYAETASEAIDKTTEKYSSPTTWAVEQYTVNQLTPEI